MAQAVYWILSALLVLAIPASAYHWGRLLASRWYHPDGVLGSLIPARRRQRPFWTPADFLVMFGILAVLSQVLLIKFVAEGWIEVPQAEVETVTTIRSLLATMAATSLAGIAALAVTILWLSLCNRNWREELGISITREDLIAGLRGALMILPPVLLISAAASYFVTAYSHPVLESLADSPSPLIFVAIFVTTALITPIVEEFSFRLLLQGGLQRMADSEIDSDGLWKPRAYWPIVVSSIVFAMMHFGQGAAPIPLFFFSLGLGYIYRQTGRIAIPIVIHVILNGLTLCVEFSRLHLPGS